VSAQHNRFSFCGDMCSIAVPDKSVGSNPFRPAVSSSLILRWTPFSPLVKTIAQSSSSCVFQRFYFSHSAFTTQVGQVCLVYMLSWGFHRYYNICALSFEHSCISTNLFTTRECSCGNVFGRVCLCLCVCLSFCALTFERLDLETSYFGTLEYLQNI